jgi:DNA-binding CsgD family transcriptional regulator
MNAPTVRELEVFAAFYRTRSRKIAAHECGITDQTAAVHLRRLYRRIGVHSCDEAAEFLGVIPQQKAAAG